MPFERTQQGIRLRLTDIERSVLADVATQFIEVASADAASDPALTRLFPDAYPDDADAAAEFRRYTHADLADAKQEQAQRVIVSLGEADAAVDTAIDDRTVQAWLRWLTDVRIVIAARLDAAATSGGGHPDATAPDLRGEDAAVPPEARYLANVYDWLGYAQEELVLLLLPAQ